VNKASKLTYNNSNRKRKKMTRNSLTLVRKVVNAMKFVVNCVSAVGGEEKKKRISTLSSKATKKKEYPTSPKREKKCC